MIKMVIGIKNIRANVIMLLLIQEVIGGRVVLTRHNSMEYVEFIGQRKDLLQNRDYEKISFINYTETMST